MTIRTLTPLRLIDGDRIPAGATLEVFDWPCDAAGAVWVRFVSVVLGRVVYFEMFAGEWEAQ